MGPESFTAKAGAGRSGKRPSLDNLRLLSSRSARSSRKTLDTPESSGEVSNPAQTKGRRSEQGPQSSQSVMTGPLNEEQRQEWYKDDNLKLRLRLNGLVAGSGLGQMRAGHANQQHAQQTQSARVASRS